MIILALEFIIYLLEYVTVLPHTCVKKLESNRLLALWVRFNFEQITNTPRISISYSILSKWIQQRRRSAVIRYLKRMISMKLKQVDTKNSVYCLQFAMMGIGEVFMSKLAARFAHWRYHIRPTQVWKTRLPRV